MKVWTVRPPLWIAAHSWWRGDFYTWTGTHWITKDESEIRGWVRLATERATYLKPKGGKDGAGDDGNDFRRAHDLNENSCRRDDATGGGQDGAGHPRGETGRRGHHCVIRQRRSERS